MKLTLVRHTSVDVAPGICYGRSDVGVAATFAQEAAAVKMQLEQKVPVLGSFDAVFTSPSSRCRLLADFCGYPDATPDPRLMEMDFGNWEMMHYDDICGEDADRYYADYLNTAPPGGESFADQRRRLAMFLASLPPHADNVLAFTHGGIIMNAMILSGKASPESVFSLQPRYGEITELCF